MSSEHHIKEYMMSFCITENVNLQHMAKVVIPAGIFHCKLTISWFIIITYLEGDTLYQQPTSASTFPHSLYYPSVDLDWGSYSLDEGPS